jgi:hypothetical protein
MPLTRHGPRRRGARPRHLKRPCPWGAATLESIFLTVAAVRNHCQENGLPHSVSWRRSQVVRQRSAKPSSPVRIRAAPIQVSTRQQATASDSNPCFPVFAAPSTHEHSSQSSRQDTTDNEQKRPLRATQSATHPLPEDADLAAVTQAWDRLPDAIRKGIVAMVEAASQAATLPATRCSKRSGAQKRRGA